ncbi:TolC family outer membrane protein [Lentilitoribacter sp. Alg239-R112]|jgi:outer membrane protein|uniref:TolC family outer membrane protein n=1 Tax=Lentilitoribacter sp. Alg239-R112 TaxID=2305987 RepID=UPI0013A6F606|nr:TolC family outer membrane protein [Lentilitoribacter sp. Alg239-R112]
MSFHIKKYLRLALVATFLMPVGVGHAESIIGAMSRAYDNNPDLAVARAGLRATDEGVAIAKSGYRPVINGSLDGTYTDSNGQTIRNATGTISITQKLFDGFATKNNVRVAEAGVFAGRENLRSTEISILQSAAQAYANLARDNQIVSIRRKNIRFLQEQLNAATSRLNVGEGTRTDVSQARAQLASAKAQLTGAIAQAKSASAVYVQIIGSAPSKISQPKTIARLLPRSLEAAVSRGLSSHPSVSAAQYNVDAAEFQINANKAALLPGVSVTGTLTGVDDSVRGRSTTKSVRGTVSVPIYSGGANYAKIRQSKQTLAQRKAQVESTRRSVEQSIVASWVSYESAVATLAANQAELKAARLALNGVVEERKVGQRTTLDVLNAQQSVLRAQESIVQNRRNAVVSSYSTLAAMGLLTVDYLKLRVSRYNPDRHYQAVKDKWFGLRTTDN